MAFILFERGIHILNRDVKSDERFLRPHTNCGGLVLLPRVSVLFWSVVCMPAAPLGTVKGPPHHGNPCHGNRPLKGMTLLSPSEWTPLCSCTPACSESRVSKQAFAHFLFPPAHRAPLPLFLFSFPSGNLPIWQTIHFLTRLHAALEMEKD